MKLINVVALEGDKGRKKTQGYELCAFFPYQTSVRFHISFPPVCQHNSAS